MCVHLRAYGDWKLIERYEGGLELVNLKDDLGEQHDLVRENAAKAKELHEVKLLGPGEAKPPADNPAPQQPQTVPPKPSR